jgi:hypothetical protein
VGVFQHREYRIQEMWKGGKNKVRKRWKKGKFGNVGNKKQEEYGRNEFVRISMEAEGT